MKASTARASSITINTVTASQSMSVAVEGGGGVFIGFRVLVWRAPSHVLNQLRLIQMCARELYALRSALSPGSCGPACSSILALFMLLIYFYFIFFLDWDI